MSVRPRLRAVTPRAAFVPLGAVLVVAAVSAVTLPATAVAAPVRAPLAVSATAVAPSLPALWHDAASFGLSQLASASFGDPTAVGLRAALADVGAARLQDSPPIDWRVLAGLDYLTGKATDTLQKLEGKQVRVPGFVVPLDDFQEDGAEFLLVPYYGACVHTPPPPPNQIIFVQMANKKAVKLALFDAIWMHGKLKIATVESPYGTVGFTIDGVKMEPYSSR
jgi:hypothetical protein